MLQGVLSYRTDDGHEIKFKTIAKDSFNDFKMQLELEGIELNPYSEYTYGCNLLDMTEDKDGNLVNNYFGVVEFQNVRRLEVKKANKYKSNIQNRELCSKISALIRYAQIKGRKNYSSFESNEFSDVREVEIDNVGKITYSLGLITAMSITNKYVTLELQSVNDKDLDEAIFRELKEKDKYGHVLSWTPVVNVGFKLSESLLGFPYESTVASDTPNILGMYSTIEEVIAANPDKNTDWILKRNYQIVTDDMLDALFQEFMDYDGLIAFDTETTGLDISFKSRTGEANELVGVVLSKQVGTGYYFPLQHKLFANLCNGDHWYFMEKYMRPILEGKKIICHNVKYDWKVAYIYDINVNCVYDTMIAFGVTKRYEEESFELGLKSLAHNILGLDMFDLSDFVTVANFGGNDVTFADLHFELVRRYAPADADMTLSLYEYIEKTDLLTRYDARMIFDLEVWFAKAVAYSEFYGYHINVDKIPELTARIEAEMNEHKQNMFKMAGYEFNPNSSQQLMKIMYDELGIEQIGEKRSTSKEVLKALSQYENVDGTPKYPFAMEVKKYRDSESIYKNFLKKLGNFATPDGYIFPEVLQLGTNTGRVSVKNPNYQSYNDVVKHYVVPRPGFIHFDSDFAQIEQRVLTSYACIMFPNDEPLALLKDFDDPDMDYHQYQAARMFNVPYAAVTKSMRQQSKGINFGLPYGMGDSSLGARIFGERNAENTNKAAALRKKFFQGQELIEKFFETVRAEGVKNNFTSTQFGRRRYYHRSKFTVAEIRRQAGNHVIQGCLDGDVRIQTLEHGIVKIKDVVGYSGDVWNGTEWTYGDVVYSGKKQKCIITFTNGQTIVCSPIHRFKLEPDTVDNFQSVNPLWRQDTMREGTMSGYFVRCRDLKPGYVVCVNTESDLTIEDYANSEHFIRSHGVSDADEGSVAYMYNKRLRCAIVKSVEITDEYIDMYDVCNTDCGYYVADGLITHNTAADIYKFAVVNMFKRVCKEGWLGKVLFNGFIHDEILMEVSTSINPYYFMKAWREEFEVKPEHYCRLFAGAGVGYCWYDAKKLDLPPDYIDEIINSYSEDMAWDGDIDKYLSDIKANFKAFKTNKVKKYIADPANQGHIIKPAIWALLPDEVDLIVEELQKNPEKLAEMNAVMLGKIPESGPCKLKDLQDQLLLFCKYYGVDFNKVDIKAPGDVKVEVQEEEKFDGIQPITFDDDMIGAMCRQVISVSGYWFDYTSKILYMADMIASNGETISHFLNMKGCFVNENDAKDSDFAIVAVYGGTEDKPDLNLQPTPFFLKSECKSMVIQVYNYFVSQGAKRA